MAVRITREAFPLSRAVAHDHEVFAIGDIHGRADLLQALLDVASGEARQASWRQIVFLGDIIDRGPDNLRAIEMALAAQQTVGADEAIRLMGNHETLMRAALDDATPPRDAMQALATWADNGGERVIIEILEGRRPPSDMADLITQLRAALPLEVADWLDGLAPNARSGDVVFVHAGVNPRFALESFLAIPWREPLSRLDVDRHWAWVRRPFLEHDPGATGWEGRFIVHGHTPNDSRFYPSHAEQIRRSRLNLDGGSAMTGVAKMGIFRGAFVEVVTARASVG